MVTRAKPENNLGSSDNDDTESKSELANGDAPSPEPTTKRKRAPRKPAPSKPAPDKPAPDNSSEPPVIHYLDETGPRPIIGEANRGPRVLGAENIRVGSVTALFAVIGEITPLTSAMSFAVAVKIDRVTMLADIGFDGKAQRYLIKRSPKPVIVWAGTIEVIRKYRAYSITSERTLEKIESSRHVTARVVNTFGIVTTAEIPLMNMRATGDRAQWVDDLDLHASSQTSMLKTIINALAESRSDDCAVIHGQGPVYFSDNTLAFAAQSVVYDESGKPRDDYSVDINAVIKSAALRYYDITPRADITDDEIKRGISQFQLALTESPEYPEIPATFLGQLLTSPLATVYRELWSGIHLSGLRGSGKTRYATRWDAVQSRRHRDNLTNVRPALPFGDTTGTVKGQQYRSKEHAGYAITTDDALKAGDSDFRIRDQSDRISNLVRSFETGGAARAGVDYKIRNVTDAKVPELASCLKITSEKIIPGDSLQNRLIMLPHITHLWGSGGFFSKSIAKKLDTPESIELQHRTWSAYLHYLISNHGMMIEHLADANRETDSWELGDPRQSARYAAIITGHYMFREFCALFDIDYVPDVTRAVAALRKCAKRQTENSVPLAVRFAEALRMEIVNGRLSYPGPPVYDIDGTQVATFTPPGRVATIEIDDPDGVGNGEHIRDIGGFSYDELGLIIGSGTTVPRPVGNGKPIGYLIPPRADVGGKSGDPLTGRWLIAHRPEQFTALCEQATRAVRDKGWNFTPNDVKKSLQDMSVGNNDRVYLSVQLDKDDNESGRKRERCVYIDAEFALRSSED